jgi:hypothetical protein
MTELHWALLAIAGVLLLALWIYGKWQERRAMARLDAVMRSGLGDPLLDGRAAQRPPGTAVPAATTRPLSAQRIEPRLALEPEDAAAAVAAVPQTVPMAALPDPAVEAGTLVAGDERVATETGPEADTAAGSDRSEPSAYALPDGWVEDPLLDFVLELRCAHAIDGVAAIEARGQLERLHLPLPTHLAVWDARTQQWTAPDRFGFYSELLLAVQLAHRNGALGEIDAGRFVAAAQQIALAVDADFDAPDVPRLVAQAAELDQLCARFDVQVTLTLVGSAAPWTADVIQGAAGPLGFVPVAAGRWELREQGVLALNLAAAEIPGNRLAVSIDVPLVPPETSPLARQFAVADDLAARLQARVVDDNGRPVQREAHFAIAAQLAGLYEQMQAAGVVAGSERARRLYAA